MGKNNVIRQTLIVILFVLLTVVIMNILRNGMKEGFKTLPFLPSKKESTFTSRIGINTRGCDNSPDLRCTPRPEIQNFVFNKPSRGPCFQYKCLDAQESI